MRLKLWFFVWLCMFVLCGSAPVLAAERAPEISAKAAVLYCANNGTVLYGKQETQPLPMASTTKIMTALLTLEAAAQDNRVVTVPKAAEAVEGSSMELQAGDRLYLRDLAVGMLTVSGNDAAYLAALVLGGSEEAFAQRMNERARELGMTDTCFVTASGLDAGNHSASALDMARLAAAAMENPDFRAICRQPTQRVTFVSPKKTITLQNHNRLLRQYDGCVGVKTGYTQKAGRCLVSAAERDGVQLICVTLCDPNDWADHTALLDYGFAQVRAALPESVTKLVPVVGGEREQLAVTTPQTQEKILCTPEQRLEKRISLPVFVYAPVAAGQVLGKVTYTIDGTPVQSDPLLAAESVGAVQSPSIWNRLGQWCYALFG